MATKVTVDMIKPFRGDGDVSWLKKGTFSGQATENMSLASFIPLYLEGDVLALYLELSEEDLESTEKIEEKLKTAFTDDAFSVFAKLAQMKWTGEPAEVYANEIRQLARLAKFDGVGLNNCGETNFSEWLSD